MKGCKSWLKITFCIIVLSLPHASFAGTGSIVVGTPTYVNLNVYYTYTPTDINVMEDAFQEASRLLFNSTNGQIRFGIIRVSTNSAFQDEADIWVNSGAGGAYTSVGALGTPGYHITVFEDRHSWTNQDGPLGTERGQFGIIHEFGHYGFDLRDEYDVGGAYPGACCVSYTSTIACIMDGGTTVHPEHHRTEWCTPSGGGLTTSHVTTPNTPQQAINGESCWETLQDYCNTEYGVSVTIPTTVETADPPGLPNIGYVIIGDELRMVISLDRSYSMSVDDKETLAKQAAALFVDLCKVDEDEALGVVSFSNTPIVEFAIQTVTSVPDIKSQAISAINGITLENMTALGDGLRESLDQITGGGTVAVDASAVEAIVLLSDGVHNYGTETPGDVLPDLIARGVRVFTIGLGSPTHPTYPLDEATLLDISNQTGGAYRHAPSATDLATIYTDFAAEIRGMSSYPEATEELEPAESSEKTVIVDKYTKEETFVLHWPYGENAFELHLRDPDGILYTPSATGGMEYVVKKYHAFYRVKNPKSGVWKMIVNRKRSGGGGCLFDIFFKKDDKKPLRFTTQALAYTPNLSCRAAPRKAFYQPGQPAIVRVSVVAGGIPVAKASVYYSIRMPDGKVLKDSLYDDGDFAAHGDDMPNDGIYSTRLTNTRIVGTYKMDFIIENKTGVTATPDEPDPTFQPRPVTPFTRSAFATFSIGRQVVEPPKNEKIE